MNITRLLPSMLYTVVASISFIMAYKSLSARTFLPFQKNAAGVEWDDIDGPLQSVILSLLRLGGLGFLVTALLLLCCAAAVALGERSLLSFAVPGAAFVFCLGLAASNYRLFKATSARTPWKGSLYAALLLLAGLVIVACR
jgi:hypothetical protein